MFSPASAKTYLVLDGHDMPYRYLCQVNTAQINCYFITDYLQNLSSLCGLSS